MDIKGDYCFCGLGVVGNRGKEVTCNDFWGLGGQGTGVTCNGFCGFEEQGKCCQM